MGPQGPDRHLARFVVSDGLGARVLQLSAKKGVLPVWVRRVQVQVRVPVPPNAHSQGHGACPIFSFDFRAIACSSPGRQYISSCLICQLRQLWYGLRAAASRWQKKRDCANHGIVVAFQGLPLLQTNGRCGDAARTRPTDTRTKDRRIDMTCVCTHHIITTLDFPMASES